VTHLTTRAATWAHASETIDAGSTQNIQEHCFGLIICRMTCQNIVGEHPVASVSGSSLQVWPLAHLHCESYEIGSYGAGGVFDDAGLSCRARANAMVDMDGGDLKIGGDGEGQKSE